MARIIVPTIGAHQIQRRDPILLGLQCFVTALSLSLIMKYCDPQTLGVEFTLSLQNPPS